MFTILLQIQETPILEAQGMKDYGQYLFIGAMIIILYFFMIRPQQKKAKDQKKFREDIKRGDLVVTIGGLHGRVIAQDDDTITLDVDKGVKLKFEKSSISLEATKKVQTSSSTPVTTTA